jgi:hypothetical protein
MGAVVVATVAGVTFVVATLVVLAVTAVVASMVLVASRVVMVMTGTVVVAPVTGVAVRGRRSGRGAGRRCACSGDDDAQGEDQRGHGSGEA